MVYTPLTPRERIVYSLNALIEDPVKGACCRFRHKREYEPYSEEAVNRFCLINVKETETVYPSSAGTAYGRPLRAQTFICGLNDERGRRFYFCRAENLVEMKVYPESHAFELTSESEFTGTVSTIFVSVDPF